MERTPTLKPLLLLDLDGVLRSFPPMSAELAEIAFEPSLLHRAITGEISDEQWREAVGPEFAATSGEVIAEALALVRVARRQCFVALLSNATTRLEADLALLGLDGEVDAVFNSSRLGVAKPDPAIYRRVLDELGYSTGVFCDDDAKNAAAAREAGLDGVHVPDTAALRRALAVRELIPPTVLLILPDRDEAEGVAASLLGSGWGPCAVHRDMLAGEDDAEDVDWVVELTTAPDGLPASAHRAELDDLAEQHDGFTGEG
ncbi:haloacid dehalogenase superfamily, subfamily IA, variant 3 with third motif having DD or ED [Lentzea albidocapillata]|uniref:Haloacid dehalogenase superfamily, subfamily IA, variant 3 with third motif having DD or ED n=1 Tax=Lentzea albidocapillata TaxID=40571 RepID=A0A1W2B6J1_9PSEU|nr:haloacid dehalogenase superfamily, subfamily IA, variant 3 with third motif having DD or ED [Lentzea albidocapillata]